MRKKIMLLLIETALYAACTLTAEDIAAIRRFATAVRARFGRLVEKVAGR